MVKYSQQLPEKPRRIGVNESQRGSTEQLSELQYLISLPLFFPLFLNLPLTLRYVTSLWYQRDLVLVKASPTIIGSIQYGNMSFADISSIPSPLYLLSPPSPPLPTLLRCPLPLCPTSHFSFQKSVSGAFCWLFDFHWLSLTFLDSLLLLSLLPPPQLSLMIFDSIAFVDLRWPPLTFVDFRWLVTSDLSL